MFPKPSQHRQAGELGRQPAGASLHAQVQQIAAARAAFERQLQVVPRSQSTVSLPLVAPSLRAAGQSGILGRRLGPIRDAVQVVDDAAYDAEVRSNPTLGWSLRVLRTLRPLNSCAEVSAVTADGGC